MKNYKKTYENLTKKFLREKTEKDRLLEPIFLRCGKVDFCLADFVAFLWVFPHRVDFPQFEVKKVVEKRVETCAEVEENAQNRWEMEKIKLN